MEAAVLEEHGVQVRDNGPALRKSRWMERKAHFERCLGSGICET